MSDNIVIQATARTDLGKGASRRLRRISGLMPAIIYGGKKKPESISIPHKDMIKAAENEALFSSVIDVDVEGKISHVIIKDLQRHPAKQIIQHVDFLRVDMKKALTVHVPLHFINEDKCHGVKMEGGRVQHSMVEIEVSCLPKDLPEYIEVNMEDAVLGTIIHISDIKLPKGVESVALSHGEDHDLPVASIVAPKGGDELDDAPVEAAGDEAATEGGEE
ncbi:MAG: large subunit ribosomal protein L25 [Chitinophagales bacterium]|jgi:large subunit ribosomal protein L25